MVGSIALVIALVAAFIFFPVVRILASAFQDNDYNFVPFLFVEKLFSRNIWGLGCVTANVNCGVAWNSLLMAILVGASTTLLGLAFALLATRTGFRAKKLLRTLTVLPVITPPFVIGLAIILLFGASGTVTLAIEEITGATPGRYIYGLPGIWLAQTLAFTPIAFLVLIGVVEGVSPSMEEAAQTLRASNWRTFTTVSLPLMRPGLANAFLVGFIESLADFGNPLVLGGNFDVLSTSIFFAIVGAQNDPGPGRGAGHPSPGLYPGRVLGPAALAGTEVLRHRHRQGRRRPARVPAQARDLADLRFGPALGRSDRGHLLHDPVRRFRRALGPGSQPHPASLHRRLFRHHRGRRAGLVGRRVESPSGPPSRSPPSPPP